MVSNHNGHLGLTDQNFSTEGLQNPEPVLVDFWATHSTRCKSTHCSQTDSHAFDRLSAHTFPRWVPWCVAP